MGTRGWAYSEAEMKKLIDSNYVLFGKDENVMPQLKNYLFENELSLPKSVLFFDSQTSTRWMKAEQFGFDFPKAIDYIKYILSMYPCNDIMVLDFFSGSATTAHAVMQLNAEDGGHRKFIMVQLPEKTDEKSEAFKAGYKNICEIGKERIRRAGKKIKAQLMAEGKETRDIAEKKAQGNAVAVSKAYWIDSPEYKSANKQMASDLDTGFRVLKLDSTNMKDVYYNPAEITIDTIMGTVDNRRYR